MSEKCGHFIQPNTVPHVKSQGEDKKKNSFIGTKETPHFKETQFYFAAEQERKGGGKWFSLFDTSAENLKPFIPKAIVPETFAGIGYRRIL